jgi:hypothetical protein
MSTTNFKIKTPMLTEEAPTIFKNDLPGSLRRLREKDSIFTAACRAENVPKAVAFSFASVETEGKHFNDKGQVQVTGAEKSTGMMQVGSAPIYDMIQREMEKNRLSPQAIAIFKKYMPTIWNTKGTAVKAYDKQVKDDIQKGLMNEECNIWAGVAYLRRLMEMNIDANGIVRLDKVIAQYNAGEYNKFTKFPEWKAPNGDSTVLKNKIYRDFSPITGAYISKIVGKNGGLSFMVKNGVV